MGLLDVADHRAGAAGEISRERHLRAALRVRQDHHVGELLAHAVDVVHGELLVNLALAMPADHLIVHTRVGEIRVDRRVDDVLAGLPRYVASEILIRQEDDRVGLERIHHGHRVADVQQMSDSAFTSA